MNRIGDKQQTNTRLFDGKSTVYRVGRPDYAEGVIDFLKHACKLSATSVIADVGSGTGKFTAQLLKCGGTVYGVEPNADMRREAENLLSGSERFISVNGTSEQTTLASRSVDLVTAAQAFHWFDQSAFAAECKRILKEDGQVALVYNNRDESEGLNEDCRAIFTEYCPAFRGFSGGSNPSRMEEFFGGDCKTEIFDNPLTYDVETFVRRSLSSSYALRPSDARYEEFLDALKELFAKYAVNGRVIMRNRSVVCLGRLTEENR